MPYQSDPNNAPARRGQRSFGGTYWQRSSNWISANSFAPSWLPGYLGHSVIGYLAAFLLAGVTAGLTFLLTLRLADFYFQDLLLILVVVVVALNWGAGPGLVATLWGAALLFYLLFLLFPPHFNPFINNPDRAVDFGLFLMVGILVSLITGRMVRSRREAEARAVQLRTALTALGEAKGHLDTFLGVTGHELRTPLAALKLSLQMTRKRIQQNGTPPEPAALGGPLYAAFLVAEREEKRLEQLVQDLLDLSRIQAGKLELYRELVDLVALVREVVEAQRRAAPDRCIALQLLPEVPLPVSADPWRVEQVVTNYLTNALKYAPAGRPIEVGVQAKEQQARVWVHDEGPGVPLEEQERIWEPFRRVTGIEVQHGSGTGLGLGLHICRMIIEQHGGQVGVESASRMGSTFWFTLPLPSPSEEG